MVGNDGIGFSPDDRTLQSADEHMTSFRICVLCMHDLCSNQVSPQPTLTTKWSMLSPVSMTSDLCLLVCAVSMAIPTLFLRHPPTHTPTGTPGNLALTTSRALEIASLLLNMTNVATGFSQLLPLTKCGNAFTSEHQFTAGNFSYKVQGVDTNGVSFHYDLRQTVEVRPSSTYSFQATNSTTVSIESSDQFTMEFELRSSDHIGTTTFELSVDAAGFVTTLNRAEMELRPMQAQIVTLTGLVGSVSVEGKTSNITVTASNGCVTLSAFRLITVKKMVNTHVGLPLP